MKLWEITLTIPGVAEPVVCRYVPGETFEEAVSNIHILSTNPVWVQWPDPVWYKTGENWFFNTDNTDGWSAYKTPVPESVRPSRHKPAVQHGPPKRKRW